MMVLLSAEERGMLQSDELHWSLREWSEQDK
jgi:hypothetical protein